MKANPAFDSKKKISVEWIDTDRLNVVWAQSQRPLDEKFAESIASNFDPDKFGMLAVTLPNGKGEYHIIDGQHRKRAIEIAFNGIQKVPCQVFDAADPARAAELFDEINSHRRAPNTLDFFRVRVTAREPDHIAVVKIVKENGFAIGSQKEERAIWAVQALLSVYRSHGSEVLDQTLKMLQATWGLDKNARVAPLIRGFAMFMSEFNKKVNWQKLHEAVSRRYTPGRFIGAAKTHREMNGGSLSAAVRDLLIACYNRGQRANAQIKSKGETAPKEEN